MSLDPNIPIDDQLDRYHDGMMSEDERRAFEQRLASDPELRRELQHQDRIDAEIRRVFAPPRVESERADDVLNRALAATAGGTRAPRMSASPRSPWRFVAALAAALAMSIYAGWQVYEFTRPERPAVRSYVVGPKRSMLAVYREELEKGFKPEWVCRNEEEFRRSFSDRFGQALAFAHLPRNVCPQGLSYEHIFSTFTMHLLVRVDDRAVVVFADKLDRDEPQTLPPDSDLHLHRRVIGDLVLYEISPFAEPRVIPYFFDPDAN
ncbi:MAG: hypothetical protein J5J06_02775 [Phycisphaerae bacterium]|nr:hypothetical protein [Phycisphaerae bacterium]